MVLINTELTFLVPTISILSNDLFSLFATSIPVTYVEPHIVESCAHFSFGINSNGISNVLRLTKKKKQCSEIWEMTKCFSGQFVQHLIFTS